MSKEETVERIAQIQLDLDEGKITRQQAQREIIALLFEGGAFPRNLFELDELIMAEIERKKKNDGQHKETV